MMRSKNYFSDLYLFSIQSAVRPKTISIDQEDPDLDSLLFLAHGSASPDQRLSKHGQGSGETSWLKTSLIGFVVSFFDVLALAPLPHKRHVEIHKNNRGRLIPGTLMSPTRCRFVTGCDIITVIEVEPLLAVMLVSSAWGRYSALVYVANYQKRNRLTMGFALLVTAGFMLPENGMDQGRSDAIGLHEGKLAWRRGQFLFRCMMTAG